jgi:hypothetical protein
MRVTAASMKPNTITCSNVPRPRIYSSCAYFSNSVQLYFIHIKVLLSIAAVVQVSMALELPEFWNNYFQWWTPIDWVGGVAIMIAILSVTHTSNSIIVVTCDDRRDIKNLQQVEIHQIHVNPKLFTPRCIYDLTVILYSLCELPLAMDSQCTYGKCLSWWCLNYLC